MLADKMENFSLLHDTKSKMMRTNFERVQRTSIKNEKT